jgi:N-acetylglucosaminyldiphosphoundecaprenol N-acetyl-beta-D-mannosaminyltransferase
LGINLSTFNEESALKKVEEYLTGNRMRYGVTPNPEIILYSLKNQDYANILNQANISLADGFGLKVAGIILKEKIIRITGSDFSLKILELAEKREEKVLIINWEKGLSTNVAISEALKKKYQKLKFLVIDIDRNNPPTDYIQKEVFNFSPTIVFLALGSPYQENVIYKNLNNWPSVRFAIGVGGTFDFITNKARRAPQILRELGMEWLWRLILQPKRIKRIYQATFVFTLKILKQVIKKHT